MESSPITMNMSSVSSLDRSLGRTPPRIGSWKDPSSRKYDGMVVYTSNGLINHCVNRSNLFEEITEVSKGEYSSFMEKEIFEQAESLKEQIKRRIDLEKGVVKLNGIQDYHEEILRCRRLILIGAASSYHVAIGTRQIIEELIELPVFVELASDFLDREVPIFRDDVCILISQSGETSSILSACQYCKDRDALVMGITNNIGSTLANATHFGICIHAGLEVSFSSTKTYTGQFLALVLFALCLAGDKKHKQKRVKDIIAEIGALPDKIEEVLAKNDILRKVANKIYSNRSLLVMGRGYQQAACLEGSFKIKEVANMHSEGIHSGELKHGPLALIEETMPIIMIILKDAVYDKSMNAIQQVMARNGHPILICEEGDDVALAMSEDCITIPKTADCLAGILSIIPLQLLALHLASFRGNDIDNPRDLQKTVIEEDVFVKSHNVER